MLCSSQPVYTVAHVLIAAVPLPPSKRLIVDDIYDSRSKPRPDVLKQHFVLEGRISDECALKIIHDATAILRAEKTMLDIEAPVTGSVTYTFMLCVPSVGRLLCWCVCSMW